MAQRASRTSLTDGRRFATFSAQLSSSSALLSIAALLSVAMWPDQARADCVANASGPPNFLIDNSNNALPLNLDSDCPGTPHTGNKTVELPAGVSLSVGTTAPTALTDNSGATWDLTNGGAIESTTRQGVVFISGGAVTNQAGATIKAVEEAVKISGGTGTVTNAGTIESTSTSTTMRGVYLISGGTVNNQDGGVIKAGGYGVRIDGEVGAILNSGTITSTNAGAFLGYGGTVTNQGSGTITGVEGILVSGGAGSVTNAGTITGTGGTAIQFDSSFAWNDTLELQPGFVISGNVLANGGTDTLRFGGTGDGAFSLSDIGSKYQSFEIFQVNSGIWNFSGTTTASFIANGGTVTGTGTFGGLDFRAGSILAPGDPIGTITVNGDLTLDPNATYQVEITDLGQTDLTQVNGTVTLNGATLQIIEQAGAFTAPEYEYVIISNDGTDAVQGTGFANVTNEFAFLVPTVNLAGGDGNDVVLKMVRNSVPFTAVGQTPNQQAVAAALQGGFSDNATPGSDNEIVLDAFLGLSPAAARAALDSMSGEIHASLASVMLTQGGFFTGAVGNRLAGLRAGEGLIGWPVAPVTCAGPDPYAGPLPWPSDGIPPLKGPPMVLECDAIRFDLWGWAWNSLGSIDGDGNAAKTDSNSAGAILGGDVELWAGGRLGLAGSYATTDIDVDARASRVETAHATILAYLSQVYGPWHAQLIGGYTSHDFDVQRNIQVGYLSRTALSDYGGDQVTITGEVGYTYGIGGIALQPIAALRYTHLTTDGFTETGAGSLDLISAGKSYDATDTILGLQVSTIWPIGGFLVAPQARAGWTHSFGDLAPDLGMAFAGGGTFTVTGVTRARDVFNLGTGFKAALSDRVTAYFDYMASLASDQHNQAVSGGVRVQF